MSRQTALADQAAQRSRGYWLLARLFLEVPNAARLGELRQLLGDRDDLAATDDIAALRATLAAALADPDEAAAAFTRHLVLGDKKHGEPLPFEAHVREGRLPGEATAEVATLMCETGFPEAAAAASSPDHLGAELRFMALLCHAERDAWLQGNDAAGTEWLRQQQKLLAQHLAQWAPEYCLALAERTTNAYLHAVARLAAHTVRDDVAILDEICRWVAPEELSTVLH